MWWHHDKTLVVDGVIVFIIGTVVGRIWTSSAHRIHLFEREKTINMPIIATTYCRVDFNLEY